MKLIAGNSNAKIAKEISNKLNIPLVDSIITKFSDGEIRVQINESVRGSHVFVIQSTNPPADNLLELIFIIDALRRASAEKITAVIPYYGYARQDKKDAPRVPISSRVVANLLTTAGVSRIMVLELHAEQIQGFFNVPVDHLYSSPVFVEYLLKNEKLENTVVVSPDAGRVNRARSIAKKLNNLPIAVIDKRRSSPNQSEVMHVVGEVKDRDILIVDDIIDTAGTITKAAEALKYNGAKRIIACVTHPLLSGDAIAKLKKSPIDKLYTSDSVVIPEEKKIEKIEVLSMANLFASAIKRVYNKESISALFD
ncbi:MAG: ribose-phosphate pyrophosphokinase [bacterium]|uniref:Ribose-phosphate pyrophosphokinase n=2 Tax=Bacteria candidate phyla TaxID=1783234 RepID=A0A117M5Z6_UNCT6|nr:MAG: Ribose-phosphate pyrophosphokinase [candidate division TA06 bacterium 32_111]KUK86217.1 MAG: Ribose-phosphate pyrophosphokinase [candidate division TA06 bacterium 34_109]MDI6700421.1 ribose-phosphate pyrophosphokinase [bacterium]HAF08233.1 phosphoribosylpyrophosphate synthetase [candidate division WOR-3 bacterium]HCP16796.1 phosphoribosylpyrophosphate synthetase [candidate division WOR-3 bacterium]